MIDRASTQARMRANGLDKLEMWTIYDRPRDYPDQVVARQWFVGRGNMIAGKIVTGLKLEALRDLFHERGLHRLNRSVTDDPKIVETWL